MPDYAVYRMTITVITPLHIGSGVELLNGYDYVVNQGRTWRLNEDALLDAQDIDDPKLAAALALRPPGELLRPQDFAPGSRLFRYSIRGAPRSQQEGAQVRELLKDVNDCPYIPGSSLKGALRTVLGWYGWGQLDLQADERKLKDSAKFAAQEYERMIFVAPDARRGHEPNYDLMRAVQVSDTQAADQSALTLINASVLTPGGLSSKDIPVELEAIRANTEFTATMKLDLALFSEWARRQGLKLNGEEWLRHLPQVCREYAAARTVQELRWFQAINSAARVQDAYRQFAASMLDGSQFLLRLGWGSGWDGNTYGTRLRANPRFMESVLSNPKYKMTRGRRQPGDPFPKSRRVVTTYSQSPQGQRRSTPAVPLGWVLVTLQPAGGTQPYWLDLSHAPQPLVQAVPQVSSVQEKPVASPPQPPQAARPAPPPQRAEPPIIAEFRQTPKPGDRFRGEIFDLSDEEALLEIPGLDPDSQAYALIALKDAPGREYRPGARPLCEVVSVEPDPHLKGCLRVRCRPV